MMGQGIGVGFERAMDEVAEDMLNAIPTSFDTPGINMGDVTGSHGGLDEWFFETDSNLTIDDLIHYFRQAMLANGGDTSGDVDALTEPGLSPYVWELVISTPKVA